MSTKKTGFFALMGVFALLAASCAGAPPSREKPQYAPWHYTFSVILMPEQAATSPKLDLSLSLLQVMFPSKQSDFINKVLYSAPGPDEYKDNIIARQREECRRRIVAARNGGDPLPEANWYYSETVNIKNGQVLLPQTRGIVIERDYESWSGGAHPLNTKEHYVLDLENYAEIKIDDLFTDFRGDAMRKIIYSELRRYSKLLPDRPLSEGIFFRDEPELTYNFFITEAGLGLYWNPYEIAPYAAGPVEIILPWRTIRPFMRCAGFDLLTKFNIYLLVI